MSSSSSSCIWCVDDSPGVSCESKHTRLRRRRETRAAREPQQVPARIVERVWTIATVKAQTGRGQVRLEAQRRRAAAPSAHDGAQNHRTRRLLKLARQVEDPVRQTSQTRCAGWRSECCSMEHAPFVEKPKIVKDC